MLERPPGARVGITDYQSPGRPAGREYLAWFDNLFREVFAPFSQLESDHTTGSLVPVEVPGLGVTLGESGTWEIEAVLPVSSINVEGNSYALSLNVPGSVEGVAIGGTTDTESRVDRLSGSGVGTGPMCTYVGSVGVHLRAVVTVNTPGVCTVAHATVVGGNATIHAGAFIRARRVS